MKDDSTFDYPYTVIKPSKDKFVILAPNIFILIHRHLRYAFQASSSYLKNVSDECGRLQLLGWSTSIEAYHMREDGKV